MSSTITCPDCRRPAAILSRFTADGVHGHAEYLRIRCAGSLTLLVDAAEVTHPDPTAVAASPR